MNLGRGSDTDIQTITAALAVLVVLVNSTTVNTYRVPTVSRAFFKVMECFSHLSTHTVSDFFPLERNNINKKKHNK